jgi:AcrR family transcriptional regulator
MNRFDKREHAKTRIGKTAAKVFNEKGFLEATIADIASAARISKGGIFHYFPTKSEILYHILSEYMDIVLGGLGKDLENIEAGSSRIQFIISRHIDLYDKNTAEAKLLLHEAHNLPLKKFKVIAEKEKKYFQIVANILSDFLSHSTSKEKLTGITFTLFGMLNWIYSWYSPKGPLTPKELSEIIYNIFTKGVVSYQSLRK